MYFYLQWSYGVLCWEVFSLGKTPYPGLDPIGVVELLDTGGRLHCPHNEACSQEMYEIIIIHNLFFFITLKGAPCKINIKI